MKKLSIKKLSEFLGKIVDNNIDASLMIWGAPGIGKSSVVEKVAETRKLELIDLRISQLAPTDLRGIPVPANGKAYWYPPEFLPTEGKGILFLDEILVSLLLFVLPYLNHLSKQSLSFHLLIYLLLFLLVEYQF